MTVAASNAGRSQQLYISSPANDGGSLLARSSAKSDNVKSSPGKAKGWHARDLLSCLTEWQLDASWCVQLCSPTGWCRSLPLEIRCGLLLLGRRQAGTPPVTLHASLAMRFNTCSCSCQAWLAREGSLRCCIGTQDGSQKCKLSGYALMQMRSNCC